MFTKLHFFCVSMSRTRNREMKTKRDREEKCTEHKNNISSLHMDNIETKARHLIKVTLMPALCVNQSIYIPTNNTAMRIEVKSEETAVGSQCSPVKRGPSISAEHESTHKFCLHQSHLMRYKCTRTCEHVSVCARAINADTANGEVRKCSATYKNQCNKSMHTVRSFSVCRC